MPKHEYDWKNGPATLRPHSLAKLTILREYIEQYIYILTRSGTVPNINLLLVDGFAGGGEYVLKGRREIVDGSPFVLINAVKAAEARINGPDRRNPVRVDAKFVFIEKKWDNWAYLRDALGRRFDKKFLDERVRLINGVFEENVEGILEQIRTTSGRKPRPIFVLDQYGYGAVPIGMIAKIMKWVPSAEVFLTLAVDWISAHASSAQQALGRLEGALRIDSRLSEFISGRREMDEVAELSEEQRSRLMLHIQCTLHEAFAKQAEAQCYTPFFITSRGSNRSYWFLHLANNSKANDVVKDLHWRVSNHFRHYGGVGTGMLMLGFDPAKQQVPFDFGDSARSQTIHALVEELPSLVRARYPSGVTLKDLYGDLCNETPASKEILGEAVNRLCVDKELEKAGAKGEEREAATKVKDSDTIRLAKQPLLFPKFGKW